MMSSERETYFPTLSPFPSGDMLNSSRTMVPPVIRQACGVTRERKALRRTPHALRLLPLLPPTLWVLHSAGEPEFVHSVPQQGTPLFEVRLGCLGLIPNRCQPFQERRKLVVKHLLELSTKPARQGGRDTAGADCRTQVPTTDDGRHADCGPFRLIH